MSMYWGLELRVPYCDRRIVEYAWNIPWFGQLMNAPQLMAYLLQVDYWMREYKVQIV